ncbi:uncharacterized protein LAJ45_07332 [Morchella importuna]|uniref:uncharacterized protein n=1 Tax=Morchella importuna TaxID=1174673 RepID=UPI001E8EB1CB|nr:uncharacterized protein LAJ45_07332 [Morchella importuna]KAH8148621.1 hypothetical protein LAJ45_07332 [Morchella importuna]
MTTPESALRTATVARKCAFAQQECCLFMESADNWRKDLLLLEMEDVERDEAEAKAEAKAEAEAEAEAEKIRMRELELEEEKGVDGSEEVAN